MPAPNDHDLLVRIDARTEGLEKTVGEVKEALTEKADTERVARLEARLDKSDERHEASDKKLNYIVGGLLALEAALKFIPHAK